MSFLTGRFHHCILLVVVLISLCQFNSAVYYTNRNTSGGYPRQGKRAGQYISNVPEREMNYLRRRDSNMSALKRLYTLLDKKRGLQNLDKATAQ